MIHAVPSELFFSVSMDRMRDTIRRRHRRRADREHRANSESTCEAMKKVGWMPDTSCSTSKRSSFLRVFGNLDDRITDFTAGRIDVSFRNGRLPGEIP